MMHRRIATALESRAAHDGSLFSDLAWHAGQAGDDVCAARAAATAGDRCLRLFANGEALRLAERGLQHAAAVTEPGLRASLAIALLRVKVLGSSSPKLRRLPEIATALEAAVASAEAFGHHESAATGHYVLSVVHQEAGELSRAEKSSLAATQTARSAGDSVRIRQLANTARCLAELELDVARARTLAHEAQTLALQNGTREIEVHWAVGLLARWDGDLVSATAEIETALSLAREARDHWREYKCLSSLAACALESEDPRRVLSRCEELREVAARLGEHDAPLATAFESLAQPGSAAAKPDAAAVALDELRQIDDKSHLAYALDLAAEQALRVGDHARANRLATEALEAARIVGRRDEAIIAGALMALTGTTGIRSSTLAPQGFEGCSARAKRMLTLLPDPDVPGNRTCLTTTGRNVHDPSDS